VAESHPRIIQFGTGRLLRGLFDPLVPYDRSINVIQSRPTGGMADAINQATDGYHLWVRGIEDGKPVERTEKVRSLGEAKIADSQWNEILDWAVDPLLNLIVSNTTERGMVIDPKDADRFPWDNQPPVGFPARLLHLLYHRYEHGMAPVAIMPLELIEINARVLQDVVVEQLQQLPIAGDIQFREWLQIECRWLSTLVDRICVAPADPPKQIADDPLSVMTEPYQLIAVADDNRDHTVLPDNDTLVWANNLQPFFRRKVRILNGLHTLMVARCWNNGYQTVADVMSDPDQENWLQSVLDEEILPTLAHQGIEEKEFSLQVMDRFRNPFFRHLLSDIAVGHEKKIEIRLKTTIAEHLQAFGKPAKRLSETVS